jgi:hypothetical protein
MDQLLGYGGYWRKSRLLRWCPFRTNTTRLKVDDVNQARSLVASLISPPPSSIGAGISRTGPFQPGEESRLPIP